MRIVETEGGKYPSLLDKNFGLSPSEFDHLLTELKSGDDTLFEKIFLHHFSSCHQYIMKNYKATSEDAHDITMDTLLAFYVRLKEGKIVYGNLRFLFTQMAGQLYLKRIKQQKNEQVANELLPDFLENPVDECMLQLLDKAWEQLQPPCRNLLSAYYFEHKTLKEIAEAEGRSDVAVRKQKQRCLDKLRNFMKQLLS